MGQAKITGGAIVSQRIDKWDRRFVGLAQFVAAWSKDPSTKVGAVIADEANRIVSLGFNGFPQLMADEPDNLFNREEKLSRIIHAEMNAILLARARVVGMTLYASQIPCDRCAPHIIQSGIKRVVAWTTEDYLERWKASVEKTKRYFAESGVDFRQL
jgi:dCMP deaminase